LKFVRKKKKKEKSINPSEICGSVIKEQEVKPQNPCNETTNNSTNNSTNKASIPTTNSGNNKKDEKKDDCDTISPREEIEVRRDAPTSNNDHPEVQKQQAVNDKDSIKRVTKVDGHVSATYSKSAEDIKERSKADLTRNRSEENVVINRVGTDEMIDYVNNHKPASNVFCGCI